MLDYSKYENILSDIEKAMFYDLEKGIPRKEICKKLGITQSFIKHRLTDKFLDIIERRNAKFLVEEEFADLVEKVLPHCNSYNAVCNKLGLRGVDGYYTKIKNVINERGLSTEHFGTLDSNSKVNFKEYSDEEFFVSNAKRNGKSIVKRLLDHGYKKYECECCGVSEWNGKPLKLQIHHINGDHCDNRIENLQILCPNCHTQTDTYASNKKTIVNNNDRFSITKKINSIVNQYG